MPSHDASDLIDAIPDPVPHSPGTDPRAFSAAAARTVEKAAGRFVTVLREFATAGNRAGCVVVRGLPGDPSLPATGASAEKATHASETWLAAAGLALGQPVGFAAIKRGALFQDNFPKPEQSSTIASGNARADLELHSELFYHPAQPRWLLLYCLRADRTAEATTGVTSWRAVEPDIEPTVREALWRNEFGAQSDLAFRKLGVPVDLPITMSVLHGDRDDPFFRFDRELTRPLTDEAAQALTVLTPRLRDRGVSIRLRANDLLVIDNWRTCHWRSAFTPYFDGADRWLQRVYVADPAVLTEREKSTWLVERLP